MGIKYTDEDLIDHHGVSAVIKDRDGRILIQEHVKYGFWTIPVGKAKIGQNVIDGMKEEVFEECNLIVKNCKEFIYKECEYIRNDKKVKVYTHIFDISDYTGELINKEPHKHSQQKFMNIKEIIKLPYLSDTTLLYLESLNIKRPSHI